MTYYVAFDDGSETVVCADDILDAIDMSTTFQRQTKQSDEIIEIKKVEVEVKK